MALEIYWKIRGCSSSVREYMTQHYSGARAGQEWHDLWGLAASVDSTLEMAHRLGGYPSVCACLDQVDRVEHWLSRLGAQIAFLRSGDRSALANLQSGRAPGDSDIMPSWAIDAARSESEALYMQGGRVKGVGGKTDDDEAGGGRRPRRRPGQAEGTAADGGKGGGGEGGSGAAKAAPKAAH